jgi:hypothetical protein
MEAERRIQTVIKGLCIRTASLWKGRNNQLHGSKEQEEACIYSAESATIRYYHSRPHLLGITDRHYCEKPLLAILRGSPSTRRRWIRRVRASSCNPPKRWPPPNKNNWILLQAQRTSVSPAYRNSKYLSQLSDTNR